MEALGQLGYTTIHYPVSFDQIALHDVSCDAFVVAHYKELDEHYPGSKFIYTYREPEAWANAVMKHLQVYPAATKSELKRKYRHIIWGDENPSREQLFLAREKLEQDIEKYFTYRPQDLLRMNISGGESWNELCQFLAHPIPNSPFPHIDTSV